MEGPHAQTARSQHQLQYRFGTRRPDCRRTHQTHPRPDHRQQVDLGGRRPDPIDRNTSDRIAEKTLRRLANTQCAHYDFQPGFYGITAFARFPRLPLVAQTRDDAPEAGDPRRGTAQATLNLAVLEFSH